MRADLDLGGIFLTSDFVRSEASEGQFSPIDAGGYAYKMALSITLDA
jgi:hypothetical protein